MKYEVVEQAYGKAIVRWARSHSEAVVLSGDLTLSCDLGHFRNEFPERFFSMGMAEQNMVSFAGGLAREGFVPLVHSFGPFLYRRALDQISMSVAFPNLRVRFFAFCPGVTSKDGATHQSVEDISIMKAIPNMTVLEVGDATEAESVLDAAHEQDGPVYIRMLRYDLPRIFPKSEPLVVGTARKLSDGDELCLVSSGMITQTVIKVAERLRAAGHSVAHFHVNTHKPFVNHLLVREMHRFPNGVFAIENHSVTGGLASSLADAACELGLGVRIRRIGFKDCYLHGGSTGYLMQKFQIDENAIFTRIILDLGTSEGAQAGKPYDVVEPR